MTTSFRRPRNTHSGGYVLLFAIVIGAILFGVTTALTSSITSSVKLARHLRLEDAALLLAEAGVDKAIYELNQSALYGGETNTTLGSGTFSVTITPVDLLTKRITATGYIPSSANPLATRTVTVTTSVDTTIISFRYGLQVGDGGLVMDNGTKVTGNIYANGNISGNGTVTGDATVASSSSISGITINGDARGHSLTGCRVLGNAYYATTNTCITPLPHSGTPDSSPLAMPISDAQIAEWEALAESKQVIPGPHTITGNETIGPAKIDGDLIIGNNASLNMSGPIWVKGNVSFSNNSFFRVAASAGNSSTVLIADDPSATTTKGIVDLSNNITIAGNGNPNSYPLAISTYSGSSYAIIMSNNATSVLLYAPYGKIEISNNASANQITAKQLHLDNNATIVYLSGLQSANFTNGPGGSWAVNAGSYAIVP